MNNLKNKTIVVGICGSIAAYKACELVSLLNKKGACVYVILTKAASQFIGVETLRALSRNEVLIDTFDHFSADKIAHIWLAKNADAFIVAPATANTIAKIAHGYADNMLTDALLAFDGTKIIAPAMNCHMWHNNITQKNVAELQNLGFHFCGPTVGMLACQDEGVGKFEDPQHIVEYLNALLGKKDFCKKVLITAGASCEDIDPVRYITNRSSGKMGIALAKACFERGADVTLVLGKNSVEPPKGIKVQSFRSTEDLANIMLNIYTDFEVIIQCAAPADYTPMTYSDVKIKKTAETFTLSLKKTKDIAQAIGKQKLSNQFLVGFAAETHNDLANAQAKLLNKNLDMIVLNNVLESGSGFETNTNIATIITKGQTLKLEQMQKIDLADIIIDNIIKMKELKEIE